MTTAAQDPKRGAELQTVWKMLPGIAIAPVYRIFNPHILHTGVTMRCYEARSATYVAVM